MQRLLGSFFGSPQYQTCWSPVPNVLILFGDFCTVKKIPVLCIAQRSEHRTLFSSDLLFRWGTRRVPHLYNQCFPFVRPSVRSSVCYRNLLQKILACFCYRKYFLALLQKLLPSSVTENTYFDLLQKPIQSPQKNPVTDRWTNPLKSTKTRDNH